MRPSRSHILRNRYTLISLKAICRLLVSAASGSLKRRPDSSPLQAIAMYWSGKSHLVQFWFAAKKVRDQHLTGYVATCDHRHFRRA